MRTLGQKCPLSCLRKWFNCRKSLNRILKDLGTLVFAHNISVENKAWPRCCLLLGAVSGPPKLKARPGLKQVLQAYLPSKLK